MVTSPLTASAAALAQAGARLRAGMAAAVRSEAAAIGRAILLTRGLLPGPGADDGRHESGMGVFHIGHDGARIAGIRQQLAADLARMGRR